MLGERWWGLAELRAATGELFLPRRLAGLLADVLSGEHRELVRLFEDTH